MTEIVTPLIPNWVHSLGDYQAMFDLNEQDLQRTILDFPASISSFAAEMHQKGHHNIVSADAQYQRNPAEMAAYVDELLQQMQGRLDHYADRMHMPAGQTVQGVLDVWRQYAHLFLADYEQGQASGRYQVADFPRLPFDNFQFELLLCADLLFRSQFDSPEQAVMELCRVSKEVRVFPLMNSEEAMEMAIGPAMLALQDSNYGIELREVPYKLQKGNNAMLRIWAKACTVSS